MTADIEINAPCVMYDNGAYTGFDIELWKEIAKEPEQAFTYNESDLKGIIPDLVEGNADAALSCIAVNEVREKIVAFSHHHFDMREDPYVSVICA